MPSSNASLKRSLPSRENGFTIIELLVVVTIFGILMSIAIPSLLNQRRESQDSSTKATLAAVKTNADTWADTEMKKAGTPAISIESIAGMSTKAMAKGTVVGISGTENGFCASAWHTDGNNNASEPLIYDSLLRKFIYSKDQFSPQGACQPSVWGVGTGLQYKVNDDRQLVPLTAPGVPLASACGVVNPSRHDIDLAAVTEAGERVQLDGFIELSKNCRELNYSLRVVDADPAKTYNVIIATQNLTNGDSWSTGPAPVRVSIAGTATAESRVSTGWNETSNWKALMVDTSRLSEGYSNPIIWQTPIPAPAS